MFIVNRHAGADLRRSSSRLLEQCEIATIGHVLHSGFVDREIRAVLPSKRVAGTAVTMPHPACGHRPRCTTSPSWCAPATSW